MALDPTCSEANIKGSIKRYFRAGLTTVAGISVTFDAGLIPPRLQGVDVTEWVAVMFGPMEIDTLSVLSLNMFVNTRQDNEGFKLSRLRDTTFALLVDSDDSHNSSGIHIPFYQAYDDKEWVQIGALVVTNVIETQVSPPLADGTKSRQLSVTLKFASKA
jgi:hypothetical protein